jgi:hypothetical protein
VDVVTAPLEKDVGLKHMPTGIKGLSPSKDPAAGWICLRALGIPISASRSVYRHGNA